MNNSMFAKAAIWMVIALVLFTVFKQFEGRQRPGERTLPYSEFLAEVKSGRIKTVEIRESGVTPEIIATTGEGERLRTIATVLDRGLMGDLINGGVKVEVKPQYARDLALQMQADGKGRVLDQVANADNPRIHYEATGPQIWADTEGGITHFVSAMGTTGTITGVSRYLKEKNPAGRIVGAQPSEGSRIPGIRKWAEAYLPKIYDARHVDEIVLVSQADAEDMARRLACEEGLFAGISAAGACCVALRLAERLENATIVFIVCDRGDRYLSTGVFPA